MSTICKNSIFWFRRDLRLRDNPGLDYCLKNSEKTLLVYIFSEEDSSWPLGGASRWWLHHSLIKLSAEIEKRGSQLQIIKSSNIPDTLHSLCTTYDASLVSWNRLYEPETIARDTEIKQFLTEHKILAVSHNAYMLCEPWEIKTSTGGPYQVFTPFWRNLSKYFTVKNPIPAPKKISSPESKSPATQIADLDLLPRIPWDSQFSSQWNPGELHAQKLLTQFIENKIEQYKTDRDYPERSGNSSLSPHLHFGEISPHDIWYQCKEQVHDYAKAEPFLRQLGWRDFASHLLFYFPHTESQPLRKDFEKFPWNNDKKLLRAWQKGMTGYPIIDAGMRELWSHGTMHNRVRMIVGSFLVKNLLIHWSEGAKWFWDCLLDADLANNTLGWQWVAGCGADAAPYFRIFNPVSQSQKFDSSGVYIRKWVPEIAHLPDKWIHAPYEAPPIVLQSSNITLGKTYPFPIVDLKETRELALEAYYSLKK